MNNALTKEKRNCRLQIDRKHKCKDNICLFTYTETDVASAVKMLKEIMRKKSYTATYNEYAHLVVDLEDIDLTIDECFPVFKDDKGDE